MLVVTSNCEVHLLSVSQPFIGLKEVIEVIEVFVRHFGPLVAINPVQLNSHSTAALAGKVTFILGLLRPPDFFNQLTVRKKTR